MLPGLEHSKEEQAKIVRAQKYEQDIMAKNLQIFITLRKYE